MGDSTLIDKIKKFDVQYSKLNNYQKDLVKYYIDCLKLNKPSNLGNHHELKQFNNKGWKVYSNDIPESELEITYLKQGIRYNRGSDRFVYETKTTSKGIVIYKLVNCKGHEYKTTLYSSRIYYIVNRIFSNYE